MINQPKSAIFTEDNDYQVSLEFWNIYSNVYDERASRHETDNVIYESHVHDHCTSKSLGENELSQSATSTLTSHA
jgi:hypothetical protein